MREESKKQMGDMLVAMATFSGIAHILMHRWMAEHADEDDIEELFRLLTLRLKG